MRKGGRNSGFPLPPKAGLLRSSIILLLSKLVYRSRQDLVKQSPRGVWGCPQAAEVRQTKRFRAFCDKFTEPSESSRSRELTFEVGKEIGDRSNLRELTLRLIQTTGAGHLKPHCSLAVGRPGTCLESRCLGTLGLSELLSPNHHPPQSRRL